MLGILLIVLGLILGSFISALSARFEKPKSMLTERSKCPKCKHELGFWDLFPILSYIFLHGKCRYCKKPIPIKYPLIEIATATLFVLPVIFKPNIQTYELVFYLIITVILVTIFVIDLETMYVPDYLVYIGIFASLIWAVLQYYLEGRNYLDLLLGPVIGGGVFLIIVLLSREKWMGSGDIGIGAMLGLTLAYPKILVNLFLAFTIGGIIGLYLMLIKKVPRKTEVPLGPFLIFGFFITYLLGEQILNWYLSFIYL